jgi:hypothetical protein
MRTLSAGLSDSYQPSELREQIRKGPCIDNIMLIQAAEHPTYREVARGLNKHFNYALTPNWISH